MAEKKKTGRALLSSVLSLLLCCAMLIGTTFAWFTDTASTSVNKIQAGTLDVELKMATAWDTTSDGWVGLGSPTSWTDAEGETLTFRTADDRSEILWEPGCEYWLPELLIRNNGDVALKFKLAVTGIDGDAELNDAIDWYLLRGDKESCSGWNRVDDESDTFYADFENVEYILLPGEEVVMIIGGYMDENAGNEYMDLSIEGAAITVYATQYTYEYDSYTNQYDADAEYEIGWDGSVATEEQLLATVTNYVYSRNEETGAETIGRQFNISSPELLAAYAVYVNRGKCCTTDKVVLTEDINLGNQNWTPIGTTEHPFVARTFDGQNHKISNLTLNGGAENPTDLLATNQGLIGVTYTNGTIVEIMNLEIHNANIYAMNSAGALIGCLDTAQSSYFLAGYTGVHDIKLTGKVTIEGGNSGGISGSPVAHWALQTGFSKITIDVEDGSYLSNIKARELSGTGVSGALGGVVAIAAWDRGSTDIESNLDVSGVAGNVGGIVGVGNQVWYQINYTGDVTVKGVTPRADGKYNYGLAIGGFAPVWHHYDMNTTRRATVVATGTLTLELTNGTTVNSNGQASDAIGGFFW